MSRNEKVFAFIVYAQVEGTEIISYPWPENGKIFIVARTVPGDSTTMKRFEIVKGKLVAA